MKIIQGREGKKMKIIFVKDDSEASFAISHSRAPLSWAVVAGLLTWPWREGAGMFFSNY